MCTSLQALAQGFLDGGCEYATNFPGFYSHELFRLLGGTAIALNEKIAYEMAFGASLAGIRSVVSFKNFGLNVAADPFLNSLVAGVNAGLVLVVTDDMEVEGSQARQDSRHYRDFFGGLWFEPTTIEEAYHIAYHSFTWSEQLDIPLVIRLTNQFFKLEGYYKQQPRQHKRYPTADTPAKYVVHPTHWQKQYQRLKEKNKKIQKFVNRFYRLRAIKKFDVDGQGVIVLGNCQKEMQDKYQEREILSIITYPLPICLIKRFIKTKKVVTILEQGNNYGFNLIRQEIESKKTLLKSDTGYIPQLDDQYRRWSGLKVLFEALQSIQPSFVVSDLTQFTAETTGIVQACLCLGSSIPVTIGLAEAGVSYPFCISGDASLAHTGIRIINEAHVRGARLAIIIIDNGGSWSTGGQMPPSGLDLKNLTVDSKEIHYSATKQIDWVKILARMQAKKTTMVLRVII